MKKFLLLLFFLPAHFILAQDPPAVNGDRSICEGSNATLTAEGEFAAVFKWYDALTNGNLLHTGAQFNTPNLSLDTYYYVEQTVNATTSDRSTVLVYVADNSASLMAADLTASNTSVCTGESTNLSSTSLETVHWFDAPTDGNLLGSTANGDYLAVTPTATTTYYATHNGGLIVDTFDYTGAPQSFTIPDGVYEIEVDAYGGRGGGNAAYRVPGSGGGVQANLNVIPGQVLEIYVGGKGEGHNDPYSEYTSNDMIGGWNGGADADYYRMGSGGGATDIRINGTSLNDRVLVAGGGGGNGHMAGCWQGTYLASNGGGLIGEDGGGCSSSAFKGKGGTQTSGGAGCSDCGSGTFGTGGIGKSVSYSGAGGGGGGGGWYGGGGGDRNGDGGGGSNYSEPSHCFAVTHTQGANFGEGYLIIKYTLGLACSSSSRVPITISTTTTPNPAFPINLIADFDSICPNETAHLSAEVDAGNGQQVHWYDAETEGNLLGISNSQELFPISPAVTTTYYAQSEGSFCSTTDRVPITIHVGLIPNITASNDTVSCKGVGLTLEANGADHYLWQPGNISSNTINVDPSSHTTYSVTGTMNGISCPVTEDVVVTVNQVLSIINPTICSNESATLVAQGADSYLWQPGNLSGASVLLSPDTTTTYEVTGTHANGCVTTDQLNIWVIPFHGPPSNLIAASDTICLDDSTTISATLNGNNNEVIGWYDAPTDGNLIGQTNSEELFSVHPIISTTYYAQAQQEIYEFTFDYTGEAQLFTVPNGVYEINIDAYGAEGGYSLEKQPGKGGRVQATLNVFPGQQFYINIGGQGQSTTEEMNGGQYPLGGWNGGGNTANWHAGAGGGATDIRPNAAYFDPILVAGAGGGAGSTDNCYDIQFGGNGGNLTAQDGGGCYFLDNAVGKGGSNSNGGDGGCNNSCGQMGSLGTGGDGAGDQFSFIAGGGGGGGYFGGGGGGENTDGGGGSSYVDYQFMNINHEQGVRQGNGRLIITAQEAAGLCATEDREAITITVNTPPTITASPDVNSCPGTGVTLTASGANTYTWTPGNLTGESVTVDPSQTTNFEVTGTTVNGCSATEEVVVTTYGVAVGSSSEQICAGQSVNLVASNADSYFWSPENLTTPTINVSPLSTTTYTIQGTHPGGCTTTNTVEVVVLDLPFLTTSADTLIGQGFLTELWAAGANEYSWSPGELTGASVFVSPNEITSYTLTGTSVEGCVDSAHVTVDVIELPSVSGSMTVLADETTTLIVTGPEEASFFWYDAPIGGNLLSTAAAYSPGIITENTIYYVELGLAGRSGRAANSPRVPVHVMAVDSSLFNVSAEDPVMCPNGSTALIAEMSGPGIIDWFDAPTAGNLIGSTPTGSGLPVSPTTNETYYAEGSTEYIIDTFQYTGASQIFVVPDGVNSININAFGARGGKSNAKEPGYGGQLQATMNVIPGELLTINIGEKGEGYNDPISGYAIPSGGWNGGGNGVQYGAGAGGGATDIRLNGTGLEHRILVAGGGGGAGATTNCGTPVLGGHGGGLIGADGGYCTNNGTNFGKGGTQSFSGERGDYQGNYFGKSGNFGSGGNGTYFYNYAAGAGGGGWYGGGSGIRGADGGGGSSYTKPDQVHNVLHTQGVRNDDGLLIITYSMESSNEVRLPASVVVDDSEDPTPNVDPLPTIQTENEVTLTPPAATDYCVGNITATTTDPITYSDIGSYTVNWSYDDGYGNSINQQQTVNVVASLPVELSRFSVHCDEQFLTINWTTASEINSSHFIIEASKDGSNWQTIARHEAKGSSTVQTNYEFRNPASAGIHFYRLVAIDLDGRLAHSDVAFADCQLAPATISIYPNPAKNRLYVSLSDETQQSFEIQLINELGQLLATKSIHPENNFQPTEFDVEKYPSGFYQILVLGKQKTRSYKVAVIKD